VWVIHMDVVPSLMEVFVVSRSWRCRLAHHGVCPLSRAGALAKVMVAVGGLVVHPTALRRVSHPHAGRPRLIVHRPIQRSMIIMLRRALSGEMPPPTRSPVVTGTRAG
jgi:hypothetical protein